MRDKRLYLGLSFAIAFGAGCGGQMEDDDTESEASLSAPDQAELAQYLGSLEDPPADPGAALGAVAAGAVTEVSSSSPPTAWADSNATCDWICTGSGVVLCSIFARVGGIACGLASKPLCDGLCSSKGAYQFPWPEGKACLAKSGFGWPKFVKETRTIGGIQVSVYTVHWGQTGQWGYATVVRAYTHVMPVWVSYSITHGGHHVRSFYQVKC